MCIMTTHGGSRNEYGGVALRRMLLFLTLAIMMVVATSSGRWPKHKKPVRKRHTVVGTITRREAGVGITGAITQPNFTGIPSSLGSRSKAFRRRRGTLTAHTHVQLVRQPRERLWVGLLVLPPHPALLASRLRGCYVRLTLHIVPIERPKSHRERAGAVKPRLSVVGTYGAELTCTWCQRDLSPRGPIPCS